MFVLKLIGVVLVVFFGYMAIEEMNNHTYKIAKYRFYTMEHTIAYMFAYGLIAFGYLLARSNWQGDWLNGAVIVAIGVVIWIFIIRHNVLNLKDNSSLAIRGSVMQAIIYIPISMVALLILFAAIAYFSQTKPVYNVNSGD